MSYPSFHLIPEFSFVVNHTYATIKTPFETGDVQLRARWTKPRRHWRLQWHNATPDEAEQLQGFVRDVRGAALPFYYTPPDPIARPVEAPSLSQESAGSLPERTRYAKYSWGDGSNETTGSYNSGALTVAANYVLTVTIPYFPANVNRAHVYVGTTAGSEKKQDSAITTSGGTWTEPASGYNAGGDALPSTNTLIEAVTVHCLEDSLEVSKTSAEHYSMRIEFEELFE